jgi:dUTP pyrophosphatase
MTIRWKRLNDAAVMPDAAHPGDAMDLRAIEDVILQPNVPTLVKTGWAIEMPPTVRAWITPRSGLALKHGITVANAPGLIDPAYRGEIGVILLWNGHNGNGGTAFEGVPFTPRDVIGSTFSGAFDGDQEAEDDFLDEACNRFRITSGDRIAQISFASILAVEHVETEELSATARGESGFGSSGVK